MTRKRKKPASISSYFKPVSKTFKNDLNELNENTISEHVQETDKNEHSIAIGHGIEIMPAVIDTNNENQVEETVSKPCDESNYKAYCVMKKSCDVQVLMYSVLNYKI